MHKHILNTTASLCLFPQEQRSPSLRQGWQDPDALPNSGSRVVRVEGGVLIESGARRDTPSRQEGPAVGQSEDAMLSRLNYCVLLSCSCLKR